MAKNKGDKGKLDTKTDTPQTSAEKTAPYKAKDFRIVGIGASAGGLEALEQFFSNMPPDSGIVFVIVQHLDPTAHSSMPEILSRFTKMPATVASNGLKVEPNSIYLIPPGKSMSIQTGMLYLQEPVQPPALKLPIDFFFRSLSKEKGPEAVCIILSGTGSDGTLGLEAIKEEQGTVFVQEPESAKYDGMPRSAIETGLADFVLKPDQMPEKLIQFLKHSAINGAKFGATANEAAEPLQRVFAILRTNTGHDFSRYKSATVRRRLQRRMSVNQINDISGYARFLEGNENEVKALQKDLLISVTSFFRDPKAFKALKVQLKGLLKNKTQSTALRVWVAGCATGEEVYSVAIVIAECMDELTKRLPVQLYGTDIDMDALYIARAGKYLANIVADVSPERLKRFFVKGDNTYSIKKEIREMVIFAPQDFIKDPPFSRMDLICCRNLLIYIENDVQNRLLPLFNYALKPGGILFLGTSETTGASKDLFTVLNRKWKIYQRREVVMDADRLKFPAVFAPSSNKPIGEPVRGGAETRIPALTEKIFLDNYAPTFAVIDMNYRLVYVRGRTGKYLEIASGQPSLSILEMAREGLRAELASAIYQATSEKKNIIREGVRVKYNDGFQTVNITVAPLTEPGIPPGCLMIIFQELELTTGAIKANPPVRGRKRVTELEAELNLTKENLQAMVEELEATNEELKSANEELQSNNEELQSSNEELDSSREELQSLNEELTTLNAELHDKNELVSKTNDDLNNFVNRTDIAIILLDDGLKIRSCTPATSDIFNIRKIDSGRPIDEITSRLVYDKMVDDAHEVIRTLQPKEVEVQRKDGYWFNMRISPYRTAQNIINGLVVSFLDINEQKKATALLRETTDYLDNLFNYASAPIIVWNFDLKITRFNNAFAQLTGRNSDEMLGKTVDILIPPDKRDSALKEINRTTMEGQRWEAVEIPIHHVDGSIRTVLWNSATIFETNGKTPTATIAQGQDITDRKKIEQLKDEFIGMVSHELRTPLTVITGAIQTALDKRISREDLRELLTEALSSSEALAAILDNLLELSRHQAGRLTLDKKPTNLSEIIRNTVDKIHRQNPERKAIVDISNKIPPLLVDPVRLERIIYNLVENAFKYSAEGTEVRVFTRQEKGNIVVGVSDHGAGLSIQEQKKLFGPFERLGTTSKKGIGLGLMVCKRLVEAHGGRIWVESKRGEGSTFLFTIPKIKPART
jgi:two-component system CheB/CheR fusion protein